MGWAVAPPHAASGAMSKAAATIRVNVTMRSCRRSGLENAVVACVTKLAIYVGSVGAKISMPPSISRTWSRGSGGGAIGIWWVIAYPAKENDVA